MVSARRRCVWAWLHLTFASDTVVELRIRVISSRAVELDIW